VTPLQVALSYSFHIPFADFPRGNWIVESKDGERFGQTYLELIGTELVADGRWPVSGCVPGG
jgi:hypothetical protein